MKTIFLIADAIKEKEILEKKMGKEVFKSLMLFIKRSVENNFLDLAVECLDGLDCKVLNNYDGVNFLHSLA